MRSYAQDQYLGRMGDDLSHSELTGKRRSRRIAFAVFGVLFALALTGTIWTRLAADQPWDDGDLEIDLSLVAVLLALTILASLRARHFGRRVAAAPRCREWWSSLRAVPVKAEWPREVA
jgi:hypothetical protein